MTLDAIFDFVAANQAISTAAVAARFHMAAEEASARLNELQERGQLVCHRHNHAYLSCCGTVEVWLLVDKPKA